MLFLHKTIVKIRKKACNGLLRKTIEKISNIYLREPLGADGLRGRKFTNNEKQAQFA
jgi:hypothetical protein